MALYSDDFGAAVAGLDPYETHLAYFRPVAEADFVDQMLFVDQKTFLVNLTYSDKMSMAASIEVRVPLLDQEVTAFMRSVPARYKIRGMKQKYLFKRAMEGILPREVVWRGKAGFGAPIRKWLQADLGEMIGDLLSEDSIRRRGYFKPQAIGSLLEDHRRGIGEYTFQIWAFLTLELWLRSFVDRPIQPEASTTLGSQGLRSLIRIQEISMDGQVLPTIVAALDRLESWIEQEGFVGWDPFDALNSPILSYLTFGNRRIGQVWVQLLKRSPLNLRPLLRIPKGRNPKAAGIFLASYWRKYLLSQDPRYLERTEFFANWLCAHASKGYRGSCWGYNFDWPNRALLAPRGTPTIVGLLLLGWPSWTSWYWLRLLCFQSLSETRWRRPEALASSLSVTCIRPVRHKRNCVSATLRWTKPADTMPTSWEHAC